MNDPPAHTPDPPATGGGGGGGGGHLSHSQRDVYDLMMATLKSWGLEGLGKELRHLIVGGDTAPDTLALALSQTDVYKARFAGNAARIKAGLPELTPAQYIATEEQYRNTLSQFGIPKGFYDDKASTDKWIGGDVSPDEIRDRAQAASDLIHNSPPEALQAWHQFYGGAGRGGAIAAILDPSRAEPLILQQVQAAQIGGAALAQGLHTNRGDAMRFASEGVTFAQAQKAYSDIASRLSTDHSAAGRFGTQFGQTAEEQATLESDAAALKRQSTLYAEEGSLFGGRGGATLASGNQGSNY